MYIQVKLATNNNSKNISSHHCLQRIQSGRVDSDEDVAQGSIRQIGCDTYVIHTIIFYSFKPQLLSILLKGNKMPFELNLLKRVTCNHLVFVSP